MNNLIKDNRGLTLIELIIVLSIVSIISSIAIPNFSKIKVKSKIKSDIQSAKVIKSAIDMYELENNTIIFDKDIKYIIKDLAEKGYLDIRDSSNSKPQTEGAEWYIDNKNKIIKIKANISESILNSLTRDERYYIILSNN